MHTSDEKKWKITLNFTKWPDKRPAILDIKESFVHLQLHLSVNNGWNPFWGLLNEDVLNPICWVNDKSVKFVLHRFSRVCLNVLDIIVKDFAFTLPDSSFLVILSFDYEESISSIGGLSPNESRSPE